VVHMLANLSQQKVAPQHWIEGWVDSRSALYIWNKI